jgi:hypothetical protein
MLRRKPFSSARNSAQRQGASVRELRATIGLPRLRRDTDGTVPARADLTAIVDRFSKGFGT